MPLTDTQLFEEWIHSKQAELIDLLREVYAVNSTMYNGLIARLRVAHVRMRVEATQRRWKIFKAYVRYTRPVGLYWYNESGKTACAPNGSARKRHREEFEKDSKWLLGW